MYSDLFSSLDGAYSMVMWFPSLALVLFITSKYYYNSTNIYVMNFMNILWKEKSNTRYNSFQLMLGSVFTFLMISNYMGLVPFMYTLTSDLFTMSSLALLLWGLLLISGWNKNPMESAAHLAPTGAPVGLLPFLVVIESISVLIRPLTLTVRLMANISAGHIVLGLLANTLVALWNSLMILPLLLLSVSYMLFEFFVSLIQAYIFTLLISLYHTEHPCSV